MRIEFNTDCHPATLTVNGANIADYDISAADRWRLNEMLRELTDVITRHHRHEYDIRGD